MKKIGLPGVLLLLCAGASAAPCAAQTSPRAGGPKVVVEGAKGRKIDALLQAYHREGLLNGSVLVAERGRVIYKRGFGYANMEFGVPNEPDTKFRTASISKPVVALLALRLVGQGKLSLDTKVSELLPDYRRDVADKVTVRHLLSHTSGIPDTLVRPGLWEREIRDPFTTAELLARYSSGGLEFEPGTKLRYGTMGYVLLSLMIEKAAGKPFEQAVREYIFEPAGMRDTGVEGASATVAGDERGRTVLKGAAPVVERMASGYVMTDKGFSRPPFMDMTHAAVGGSVYSTVEDLFLLDRALYDDRVLPARLRDAMFTPVMEDTALGWNVRGLSFADLGRPFLNIVDPQSAPPASPPDFRIAYKLGDLWGFSGLFARHVDEQHAVVILVNANTRGVYFDLNTVRAWQAVASILYDRPYFTPRERMFADLIARRGFDRALETFRRLKKEEPHSPVLRAFEFNVLGYEVLAKKQARLAVGIFRLNAEAHPLSANAYLGAADAYAEAGDREVALRYYEKGLEVIPRDPATDAAFKERLKNYTLEMLRKLKEK